MFWKFYFRVTEIIPDIPAPGNLFQHFSCCYQIRIIRGYIEDMVCPMIHCPAQGKTEQPLYLPDCFRYIHKQSFFIMDICDKAGIQYCLLDIIKV